LPQERARRPCHWPMCANANATGSRSLSLTYPATSASHSRSSCSRRSSGGCERCGYACSFLHKSDRRLTNRYSNAPNEREPPGAKVVRGRPRIDGHGLCLLSVRQHARGPAEPFGAIWIVPCEACSLCALSHTYKQTSCTGQVSCRLTRRTPGSRVREPGVLRDQTRGSISGRRQTCGWRRLDRPRSIPG
jgi:hypothetical protein